MAICGKATPNCTLWALGLDDSLVQADPDIAGIGIVISFIATSCVTILIALVSFLLGLIREERDNAIDAWVMKHLQKSTVLRARIERTDFWQPIVEGLALNLSDQQLLVGISILVAGFVNHCSISVYHFVIVYDLAWFSSNTHMTSLLVLEGYLSERSSLRNWRVGLMLVTMSFLSAYTILQGHKAWYTSWNCSAQCVFDDILGNISGEPAFWMTFNLLLLWYGYTSRIIQLYDSAVLENFFFYRPVNRIKVARDTIENKRCAYSSANGVKPWFASIMLLLLRIILQVALAVWITIAVLITSNTQMLCFDMFWLVYSSYGLLVDRASLSTETEGNENEWGFGQIVPLLLLSSTIMLFKELYTDQKAKLSAQALDKNGNSLISLRNSLRSERTISDDGSQHVTIGAVEPIFTSPRRVDTEAGGHEDISGMSLQRRPTAHALLDRTSQ